MKITDAIPWYNFSFDTMPRKLISSILYILSHFVAGKVFDFSLLRDEFVSNNAFVWLKWRHLSRLGFGVEFNRRAISLHNFSISLDFELSIGSRHWLEESSEYIGCCDVWGYATFRCQMSCAFIFVQLKFMHIWQLHVVLLMVQMLNAFLDFEYRQKFTKQSQSREFPTKNGHKKQAKRSVSHSQ